MILSIGSSARRSFGSLIDRLPETVRLAILAEGAGYQASDIPLPVVAPVAPTRLYIAPANSAGQGFAWARAAERLPGVGAVDMQFRTRRDFGFPADYDVPSAVGAHSDRWARGQFEAVSRGFTHVIGESTWPLFGKRFRGDLVREVRELRAQGVAYATLSHGSDIRSPDRHRAHEPLSPFHDLDLPLTRSLQARVSHKTAIVDAIGGTEFISTPDLWRDRPDATWLPVVVDAATWADAAPVLERPAPVVIHAPSFAGLKGTELILDTADRLSAGGAIDFRRIEQVPAAAMPDVVRRADVVLDQFSLGIYGVAAVEAMAAGRLVVSHVSDFVRAAVLRETGLELPIVEAVPDTLEDVLADVRDRPDHYRAVAERGPLFAAAVHDGRRSAEALAPFLGAV